MFKPRKKIVSWIMFKPRKKNSFLNFGLERVSPSWLLPRLTALAIMFRHTFFFYVILSISVRFALRSYRAIPPSSTLFLSRSAMLHFPVYHFCSLQVFHGFLFITCRLKKQTRFLSLLNFIDIRHRNGCASFMPPGLCRDLLYTLCVFLSYNFVCAQNVW